MKTQIKKSLILLWSLTLIVVASSCRSEDDLSIDPPIDANIEANSTIAELMSKVAMNDGSIDNMIDSASNLRGRLPITVKVNAETLVIAVESDYQNILDAFDISDEDDDIVEISYPITVILADYSARVVNSDEELDAIANTNENEDDDDIECIDFEYPITASVFNENSDTVGTVTINNDNQMYDFIEELDEFLAVTINFPITVNLPNGDVETINTIQELEDAIAAADNTCDEDDDNDFNECNTNFYNVENLQNAFADCTVWTVDKLKRDNNNLVDLYVDYEFTFNNDGTITITENTNVYSGTWEATGPEGNVDVTIDIAELPDFNLTWDLCKINLQPVEKQIELKLGTDRLRFGSLCLND